MTGHYRISSASIPIDDGYHGSEPAWSATRLVANFEACLPYVVRGDI